MDQVQKELLDQRLDQDEWLLWEYSAARDTLYRRWWECLTESEDYQRALSGELGEPWAGMARDFGDLDQTFMAWWFDRGRYLFADEVYTPSVRRLRPFVPAKGSEMGYVPLPSQDLMLTWHDTARPMLNLAIPLTLDRSEIVRQVERLVKSAKQRSVEATEAGQSPRRNLYPDQRIRMATIDTLLRIWRARKASNEEWWQIGEREKLRDQFTCQPDDNAETIKRKRRLMTLTVQRYHKMAGALIDFAARGDFPRVK